MKLLKIPEAAALLGYKPATLEKDRRHRHLGIPFIRLGRSVRYREEDLLKHLEARTDRRSAA